MNYRPEMLQPVAPSALAREPDFVLGSFAVSPSRLDIATGGKHETVQPRVMQVLVMLVRARGAVVSRDDLIGHCWGGRAVGDDSINRCIQRLRRLSALANPAAFTIETVPRVGYRLHANHSAEPAREIAAIESRQDRTPLLAVVPFDNLSNDADLLYFSDGLTEEILHTIARTTGIKVIGRSSSFQFRGAAKVVKSLAGELQCTHVLDGSVRRSGGRVRVVAYLIDCGDATTLWSGRFEHDLVDVFALQDEIAAAVAAALKVVFLPMPQREAIDPAAYDLYLKALEIRNRGLETDVVIQLIGLLRRATELAPTFAGAWVFLAAMQAECLRFDKPEQPHAVTSQQIVAAAETALKLDSRLGGAHQALGQLEPFGHFAIREAFHRKALSVAPADPTVLTNASLFFAEVGFVCEALGFARQAFGLDPKYPWAANWFATLLDYAGRYDESSALWDRLCALWPDNELICWSAIGSAAGRGDWVRFDELAAAANVRGLDTPTLRQVLAYNRAMRAPGLHNQARAMERAQETLGRTGTLPLSTYTFLYEIGLKDETFAFAEQASFAYMFDRERRSPNGQVGPALIFGIPYNTAMMRDIRFVRLCARLGLCDYWVNTDRWPDCAHAVASQYDFRAEAQRLTRS